MSNLTINEQFVKFGATVKRLIINYDNNRCYNPGLTNNNTRLYSGSTLIMYRKIQAVINNERVDIFKSPQAEIKNSTLVFCGMDDSYNVLWERELSDLNSQIGDILCMPEDGRLFWWNGKLFCSYTKCIRNAKTYGILRNKQRVIQLYPENEQIEIPLAFGYNNEIYPNEEKNWQFFEDKKQLRIVYQIYEKHIIFDPFTENIWEERSNCFDNWVKEHGIPHGGTPPILLPTGEYLSFFNSYKELLQIDLPFGNIMPSEDTSIHTGKRKRQYRIGAYCFKGEADNYTITKISKEPFAIGSEKEGFSWCTMIWKPLAVFAVGAILREDVFELSYGVNDCWSEIATIPYQNVINNLVEV
jgi:hypothetical protein